MQSHKEKFLEYLEKEYDSLGSQIESITNRAGIAVTLLSGVAFLALENVATGCRTISFFGYVFSIKVVLGVIFLLSILPLLSVLLFRKRFERLCFVRLYNDLYAASSNISTDPEKFYTELLLLICIHNKKQLQSLSWCYNLSMIFLLIFVFIYLFL